MTDELQAKDNAISLQAAYESGRASRDAEVEALRHKIQNLQRYELRETWETAWMSEDATGEFVTYADVLKLLPVKGQENNTDKQE